MQQITREEIIKIQSKGLVTIPKRIRQKLGFTENSLVRVKEDRGRLIMESVRTLSYPVRSYTADEIDEFLELDQKETKILKKKGLL